MLTDDSSRFGLPRSKLLIKTAPLFYLGSPYLLVREYTPIEMPYRKVITFGRIGIKTMNTHAYPERRCERSPVSLHAPHGVQRIFPKWNVQDVWNENLLAELRQSSFLCSHSLSPTFSLELLGYSSTVPWSFSPRFQRQ